MAKRVIVIHQSETGEIVDIYVDDPEQTTVVVIDESVEDVEDSVGELFTVDFAQLAKDFDAPMQMRVGDIVRGA